MCLKTNTKKGLEGLKISNRCELTSTWNLANSTNQQGEGVHGTPHPKESTRRRNSPRHPKVHPPLDAKPNPKTWQKKNTLEGLFQHLAAWNLAWETGPNLFSRRRHEGISFPNFCREVHPENALLQTLRGARCSAEQSMFQGAKRGENS